MCVDDSLGWGISLITLAVLIAAGTACPAAAGGGFSGAVFSYAPGPASTSASQTQQVDASGQYGYFSSRLAAQANTALSPDGKAASASAGTGNVSGGGAGAASAGQSTSSQSTSLARALTKGSNSIAKGRTETHTVITVNGKEYIEADVIARAVARITDLGSSSMAAVDVNILTPGNGYGAPAVNTHSAQRAQ
jgi:hypothetical protein